MIFLVPLQIVHGTLDTLAAPIKDMRINHRGFNVLMTKQLLNRSYIVTVLQELRREGMAKGVAGSSIAQAGLSNRAINSLLDDRFMNVMLPLFAGFQILPSVLLREDPLPFALIQELVT